VLTITLIDRQGHRRAVTAEIGQSLLHAIRRAGSEEPPAVCGGGRSCGSCHVHVTRGQSTGFGRPTRAELELLEGCPFRSPASRLACHILCTAALDGWTVAIPAERGP
jgi:2Fe-2S ferredoxin